MHFALVLSLLSSPIVIHAVSLGDALRNQAGASKFAQMIQSSAELSALVRSGSLTIFAPADINSGLTYLRRRATEGDTNSLPLQLSDGVINTLKLRTVPGEVIETKDNSSNLNKKFQAVVSHPPNFPNRKMRRTIGNLTGETITISSGLGNNVSIIRGDIPFDGGLIHVVDE